MFNLSKINKYVVSVFFVRKMVKCKQVFEEVNWVQSPKITTVTGDGDKQNFSSLNWPISINDGRMSTKMIKGKKRVEATCSGFRMVKQDFKNPFCLQKFDYVYLIPGAVCLECQLLLSQSYCHSSKIFVQWIRFIKNLLCVVVMPHIVFPCTNVAILILHPHSPLLILYYQET